MSEQIHTSFISLPVYSYFTHVMSGIYLRVRSYYFPSLSRIKCMASIIIQGWPLNGVHAVSTQIDMVYTY